MLRSKPAAGFIGIIFLAVLGAVVIRLVFDDNVEYRIVFLFAFCASLLLGARDRSVFSPYYLFSLVPLSVALYDYRFVPYYLNPLTSDTYSLILYNTIAFLIGLSAFRFTSNRAFENEIEDVHTLTRWTWIFIGIGLVPTVYVLFAAPTLVMSGRFLEAGAYAQDVPYSWVFGLFKYFGLAAALKTRRRSTLTGALALCIIALVLSFNKTQMLFFLMTLFVALYRYYQRTQRQKRIFRGITVIGFSLLLYSVAVYDDLRQEFDSTANLIRVGASQVLSEGLMLPYMYFVSAWNNLQFVMQTQPDHTWGAWAVRPLLVVLGQADLLADKYVLMPESSFNTFSFLTIHWKDFGFIGSGIMTLLLAVYVSWLFQSFRSSGSPMIVAIFGINAVATIEMFFSNHFFGLGYPFIMTGIGLVLQRVFFGSRARSEGARGRIR